MKIRVSVVRFRPRAPFPRTICYAASSSPGAHSAALRQFCQRSPVSNSLAAVLAECRSGAALCALPAFVEAAHPDLQRICAIPEARADIRLSFPERSRQLERCVNVLDWLRGLRDAEDHLCFRQNPMQALCAEPETILRRQA